MFIKQYLTKCFIWHNFNIWPQCKTKKKNQTSWFFISTAHSVKKIYYTFVWFGPFGFKQTAFFLDHCKWEPVGLRRRWIFATGRKQYHIGSKVLMWNQKMQLVLCLFAVVVVVFFLFVFFLMLLGFCFLFIFFSYLIRSASTWFFVTYCKGHQRRLRWARASTQSRQRFLFSHAQSMEIMKAQNKT